MSGNLDRNCVTAIWNVPERKASISGKLVLDGHPLMLQLHADCSHIAIVRTDQTIHIAEKKRLGVPHGRYKRNDGHDEDDGSFPYLFGHWTSSAFNPLIAG